MRKNLIVRYRLNRPAQTFQVFHSNRAVEHYMIRAQASLPANWEVHTETAVITRYDGKVK